MAIITAGSLSKTLPVVPQRREHLQKHMHFTLPLTRVKSIVMSIKTYLATGLFIYLMSPEMNTLIICDDSLYLHLLRKFKYQIEPLASC